MTGKIFSMREWLKRQLFQLSPRGYDILARIIKRASRGMGETPRDAENITAPQKFDPVYKGPDSAVHTVHNFEWIRLPSGPFPRLDAGAIQIGHLLYCIGGYEDQDHVLDVLDVFDLEQCQWAEQIPFPAGMPHSHLALTCGENRYIYSAGGQLGPRCMPAVADAFAFDTVDRKWSRLPSLPEPRYAATMQLWQGRLHILGGSLADRYTPATDHWSLGVKSGRAVEGEWRVEPSIPRGGMHRASAVINDQLYVFGGQEGDFIAIADDPNFTCTGETVEYVYADVFRMNNIEENWTRISDMPAPASHTEFSIVADGPLAYIFGGSCYKDPKTFEIELLDIIQMFDARTQSWRIAGRLPFRVKTCLTAFHDGWFYTGGGQRDRGSDDPRPGSIESGMWRAKLVDQKNPQ